MRASVHYLPCPTCANTSALPAVFRAPRAVTASADTDVADDALGTPHAWLDADAVQNLLAAAPPETVDDVVARAQAAVARLVVGVDGWIREEVADGESTDDEDEFVDDEDGDLGGYGEDEFLDDRSDEITDAGELTDEEYVSDPAVRALRSKTFRLG
ncbi:hypothetical protein AMAG_05084 [Allomyces macrogynus ATCC 38327]|uniref:Uncharacterized protein n=1 Tax=Allomyces macrogynus (strain ATCC 38327) TaxID=578462 RepID=A0A0L0S6P3_ALLM3|nr:hypothetical protein AMAG_05084 [Allomyces macrogynus ATCC 38327]|eukprot:KNE58273.1 hypothetical protein AMAG_05084 [Allomyces macrogynus ATCC 38327]